MSAVLWFLLTPLLALASGGIGYLLGLLGKEVAVANLQGNIHHVLLGVRRLLAARAFSDEWLFAEQNLRVELAAYDGKPRPYESQPGDPIVRL